MFPFDRSTTRRPPANTVERPAPRGRDLRLEALRSAFRMCCSGPGTGILLSLTVGISGVCLPACIAPARLGASASLINLPEPQRSPICLGDVPDHVLFQEGPEQSRVVVLPLKGADFAANGQGATGLDALLTGLELPPGAAEVPPPLQVLTLPCAVSTHVEAAALGKRLAADLVVWGQSSPDAPEGAAFAPRLTLLERKPKLREDGSSRWAWGEVRELDLQALGPAAPDWLAQAVLALHFYRTDQPGFAVLRLEASIQSAKEAGLHRGLHPLYAALGWNQLLADTPLAAQAALRMAEEEARAAGDARWELLALRAQADIASMRGELGEARRLYDLTLERYQAAGDRLGIADCRMGLADLYMQISDLAEARRQYTEALALYQDLELDDRVAGAMRGLGDVAIWMSDYTRAEDRFMRALGLYSKIGLRAGEAASLQKLGDVKLWIPDAEGARQSYGKALELQQADGDPIGEANALMGLGNAERVGSEYSKARSYYEQAIKGYQKADDELGQANALRALADVLALGTSYDDARFAYDQALALYEARGSLTGQAACLRGLAYLERSFGVGYARRQYESALHLSHKAGDRIGEAHSRLGLGQLAVGRLDYHEARTNFERGQELYRQAGYSLGQALSLQGLGEATWGLGDSAAARVFYGEALKTFQGAGLKQGEMLCHLSLGQAAMRASELRDAQKAYGEAARVAREIKDRQGEADALFLTARLMVRLGQPQSAVTLFEQARDMYRNLGVMRNLAIATADLGTALLTLKQEERGRPLLQEASTLFEQIGMNGEAESCRSLVVVPPALSDSSVPN